MDGGKGGEPVPQIQCHRLSHYPDRGGAGQGKVARLLVSDAASVLGLRPERPPAAFGSGLVQRSPGKRLTSLSYD